MLAPGYGDAFPAHKSEGRVDRSKGRGYDWVDFSSHERVASFEGGKVPVERRSVFTSGLAAMLASPGQVILLRATKWRLLVTCRQCEVVRRRRMKGEEPSRRER